FLGIDRAVYLGYIPRRVRFRWPDTERSGGGPHFLIAVEAAYSNAFANGPLPGQYCCGFPQSHLPHLQRMDHHRHQDTHLGAAVSAGDSHQHLYLRRPALRCGSDRVISESAALSVMVAVAL